MARFYLSGGSGGSSGSDDCTATQGDVIAGRTAIVSGSDDEPVSGTLQLTGNAQTAHVLSGETFYTTNPKSKLTGTMTVNSLLSFSVAAYSGRRVLAKWQNPNQAAGKPFSGVIIRYSTSGYPGSSGGTQIYKGYGNNASSGGQSQQYIDLPNLNTTYYLSIYPYVTCSAGEKYGSVLNASVKTSSSISKTFTSSQNYTIPAGYTLMDAFLVGGGQGGGSTYAKLQSGDGGAGGYTTTKWGISVSPGNVINVIIGAGGNGAPGGTMSSSNVYGRSGGTSSIARNGTTLASANGGNSLKGGSGPGIHYDLDDKSYHDVWGNGGSDGGNGYRGTTALSGYGQGSSTRAWGTGTLYSGGGGAGGLDYNRGGSDSEGYYYWGHAPGVGGSGGGASGGTSYNAGNSATANTGGGGGGSGAYLGYDTIAADMKPGGNGGSGIVLIILR